MGVVPNSISGKIEFFENRVDLWTANAATIGLTPSQATAVAALAAAARDAYTAAQIARDNAKSATETQNIAVDLLASLGGDLVKTIRTYAETNNTPMVYALANVPAPAEPEPLGPPATPTDLNVTLNNTGGADLTFKASKAGGTTFIVQRRTQSVDAPASNTWTTLGVTEAKTFTDDTLPRGLAQADYRVFATRSAGTSQPTQPVSILFGTTDSSGNVSMPRYVKLAA